MLFDYILLKPSSLKPLHHNTQNASNAQQQSSQTIVELYPPNAGSHSGGNLNDDKFDLDTHSKSTTPITTEHLERYEDYEKNLSNINETIDIAVVKQSKMSLIKFDNEVTTEKIQFKSDKNADAYSGLSEPHEASNSINENVLPDVDTNIIEVEQPSRNGSMFLFYFFFTIFMKKIIFYLNKNVLFGINFSIHFIGKSEDKNVVKSRSNDVENRNQHNISK